MKLILLITLILAVGFLAKNQGTLPNTTQNLVESSTANADNGGTAEFVQQVRNSTGE